MLVLAATQQSDLGHLIAVDVLNRLFERTIRFLQNLRAIPPTLEQDCVILEAVVQVVNDYKQSSQSFSSMDE